MPIRGLTDRVGPGRTWRLGSIRKGELRTMTNSRGKTVTAPVDLEYFRFVPKPGPMAAELAAIWTDAYGAQPQKIEVNFDHEEIEDVWQTWMEAYNQSYLKFRCDGKYQVQWINEKDLSYTHDYGLEQKRECPYCTGKVPRTKDDPGDEPHGYLEVMLMPFILRGRVGTVTVHTGSSHDLPNLTDELRYIYTLNGGTLLGARCYLVRVLEDIGTRYQDGNGKWHKNRDQKWMLHILPHEELLGRRLREQQRQALQGVPLAQPAMLTDAQHAGPSETEQDPPAPANYVEADYVDPDDDYAPPPPPVEEQPADRPVASTRPFAPQKIKELMIESVERRRGAGFTYDTPKIRHNAKWKIEKNLLEATGDDEAAARQALQFLVGEQDMERLDDPELETLRNYLAVHKNDVGEWELYDYVVDEVQAMLAETTAEQPSRLPLEEAQGSFFENTEGYGIVQKRAYAEKLFQKAREHKAKLPGFNDETVDTFIATAEDLLRSKGVG